MEMQGLCVEFGARMTRPFSRGRVQVCFRFAPYSEWFFRLSERLYYSSFQAAECEALQIHVQPNPYPCPRLFLKKTSIGNPPSHPSLPRVTISLGLGLISPIRRFRTFKALKAFGAALRLPSQSLEIVRFSHRRGGHLTTPGHYKTHHIRCWNPPSTAPLGVAQ